MPREVYKNDYTFLELQNLKNCKCWCGVPRHQFQKRMRKYCKVAHRVEWYSRIISWGNFRNQFLRKHGHKCDNCKISEENLRKANPGREIQIKPKFEVDHIQSVAAGGPMWDEKNLQVLCYDCHKDKTKIDMAEITKYKRKRKKL